MDFSTSEDKQPEENRDRFGSQNPKISEPLPYNRRRNKSNNKTILSYLFMKSKKFSILKYLYHIGYMLDCGRIIPAYF